LKKKVIVALSGGVDSAVAAALLRQAGYDCVGVFMRVGVEGRQTESTQETPSLQPSRTASPQPDAGCSDFCRRPHYGCCSAVDALDAQAIAGRLGIPLYILNFQSDFDAIIEYFIDEYLRGRTPNPCIVCNNRLKFGKLLRYADLLGAEYVATGHYARLRRQDGQLLLARAANEAKDQSYVLFGIARSHLWRCLFPIGELSDKQQVRRLAAELGLRVHDKPDSQEICFVPDKDHTRLVSERRPEAVRPGPLRDTQGNLLGQHRGIANYTIGQRHGLRIALGHPAYVIHLDAATNTVTLGSRQELLRRGLIAEQVNWLTDPPAVGQRVRAAIKIRRTHTPAPGTIRRLADQTVEVRFDEPQAAVTPGQAAVFYRDDIVLGGGWIERSLESIPTD